ncbi:MAG TPA: hypothetical protein V6C85_35755 [Allocoleopsis sp.]
MILSFESPIYLEYLDSAWTSFIELKYLDLSENESLFDAKHTNALNQAVHDFIQHVSDNNDREEEIRRAMAWVLNLSPAQFESVVRNLRIPFPRFNIDDIRRFLELLWEQTWCNWKIEGFEATDYEIEVQNSELKQLFSKHVDSD